ncbi:MAG: phage/plasmid primase, P4 family, partial [Patescibacteria group bacterium]|nr:phage/plasmid primase, P4 family [Patescibacteria group bacterium]
MIGKFLEILGLKPGELELRCFNSFGDVRQIWPNSISEGLEDAKKLTEQGYNIFFGVGARRSKKGDKRHISKISALWADLDVKDFKGGKREARSILDSLKKEGYNPSVIVNSGHGFHAYWLLEHPVKGKDVFSIEPILKGIAERLNGDRAAAEIARIMRLPGTINFKEKPFVDCKIIDFQPERKFTLEQLKYFFKSDVTPIQRWKKKRTPGKIPEGQRAITLMRFAGSMRRPGLSFDEILAALHQVNQNRCIPPVSQQQLEGIARSCENYGPADTSKKTYRKTDLGNSNRLVDKFYKNLKYCANWKKWLFWDGQRWKRDGKGKILNYARKTVAEIWKDVGRNKDTEEKRALVKWAGQSESVNKLKAMIELAQSDSRIAVEPEDFDQKPMLLNVENGTVDLETGTLRKHQREDLLTMLARGNYKKDSFCPRFQKFMSEIFQGDKKLISFLQTVAGYAFTGSVVERKFFIFNGTGSNGKSVLSELLLNIAGSYGEPGKTEIIMNKKFGSTNTNDIAALASLRLVTLPESAEGARLD